MQKLTVNQVFGKLKVTDFAAFDKPGKNKGSRGQLLENALGIPNGSSLKDMIDGELKSFTQGETIAVTQLKHCLSEIIEDSISFDESKVGQKLKQTIYVGFSRANEYLGTAVMNEEIDPEHYQQLREDYDYICDKIRYSFDVETELNTITGPNNLLQIRTKASKNKSGNYTPLCYNGIQLKDKAMAFYLVSNFGKTIL
jgi:DNA mismatch repair protein MutH